MSPDLTDRLRANGPRPRICRLSNDDDIARFEQIRYMRHVPHGQRISAAGSSMDFIAIIQTGAVVVARGKRVTGLLVAGDFIGMVGRAQSECDLVALGDCLLKCYRRKTFEELLRLTPALSNSLTEMATDELAAEREWASLAHPDHARARIAGFLASLFQRSTRCGHVTDPVLELPQAATDFLGVGRDTFFRHLFDLEAEGAIRVTGISITLCDATLLRA